MSRVADRLLGRPPAERNPFATRPFGTTIAEAAAAAARAESSSNGTSTGTVLDSTAPSERIGRELTNQGFYK